MVALARGQSGQEQPVFPKRKYKVFDTDLTAAEYKTLRDFFHRDYLKDKKQRGPDDRSYQPVFKYTGDGVMLDRDRMDNYRLSKSIADVDWSDNRDAENIYKRLESSIQFNCRYIHQGYRPVGLAILVSLPGGGNQDPHLDFVGDDMYFEGKWKGSGLVALSQDAELSVGEMGEHRVKIVKGHMVLFRADLMHSGVGYKTINIRIHTYFSYSGDNETGSGKNVAVLERCPLCSKPYGTIGQKRWHVKYGCRQNDDNNARRVDRRVRGKEETPCKYCRIPTQRDNLYRHQKRCKQNLSLIHI